MNLQVRFRLQNVPRMRLDGTDCEKNIVDERYLKHPIKCIRCNTNPITENRFTRTRRSYITGYTETEIAPVHRTR